MVKFKRVLAVVLSATMVLAGSLTAFAAAEDPEGTLTGTETVNGAGTGEGHVNKKVMSMVLPTNVASVFNYTMDPERLIQATDHARYSDFTFPAAASDTGVYFLVDTKEYANAANKVTVINKGSVAAKLTVSIKADGTNASTDIGLLDAAPDNTATTAGLYLEAKIAGKTQAIKTDSPDVVVVVPGNTDNYKVVYDAEAQTPGYKYQMKTEGLTPWKAVDIEVSGVVTNGIAVTSTTTAPKIVATWSFAVAADGDTSTSGAAATDYSDTPATTPANASSVSGTSAYVKLLADSSGVTSSTVTAVSIDGTATTNYSVGSSGVITVNGLTTGSHTITVVNSGTTYTATVTIQ